jgi:hypothetical protein
MRRRKIAWKEKARRLLLAAKDFSPDVDYAPHSRGSAAHQALFRQYVKALTAAKEDAEDWWESLIEREEQRVGDRDQAVENVTERRPTGLMSLGASDAVVREYWLKCDALNRKTKNPEERVPPEEFLLLWLVNNRLNELAEFLADMPYWPIGMDEDGNWV